MVTTLYGFPLNIISLPAERADATGINSVTGKFLSANTCNIFVPTSPVAPTTATFIFLFFYVIIILVEKLKALLSTLKLSGFSFSSVLFYKDLAKEKSLPFYWKASEYIYSHTNNQHLPIIGVS
jgi:hypothetical protein